MPKEQINTPAQRTITRMRNEDGEYDGSYAQGWRDSWHPVPEGTEVEPTAVVSVKWTNGLSPDQESMSTPDSGYMQLSVTVSEAEVLRAADAIRKRQEHEHTLIPLEAHELRAGEVAAVVEYPVYTVSFDTIALTRHEAQKLIRFTRKARDVVHGVDE